MNRKVKYIISIVSFLSAIVIGFIALFLPPQGAIDSSVLWFTSQLLVFTATLLGASLSVDYGKRTISTETKMKDKED